MTESSHEPVRTRLAASGFSFVIGGAAALLLQILAVRTLGAALYGQYATVIAVVALCELAALNRGGELALGALGNAWVSQRWVDIKVLTPTLVRADQNWAFGSFGILVLIAFLPVFELSFEPYWLLIAGIAIPMQIGYGADKAILIVSGQIATLATAEITISLIGTSLAIVLLYAFGAIGLVAAYAAAAAIKVVLVRRLANAKRRSLPQGQEDPALDSRHALSVQLTTTARNLVTAFSEQADIILLSALAGPAAAGTYKVAKSLATLPARAVGPIWASLRPELVRYWFAADRSHLRSVMFRPTLLLLLAGFAAIPICWYFGTPILSRIYRIDGTTVIPALTILLVGSWIYFGLAGWYRFMMLLDANKWRSLTWSVGQALWIVAVGALVASRGPVAMAVIVAIGQMAISALAVAWLVHSTKRPS
jgi:O-antigen/teichoic acid export membrane protein